MYELNEIAVMLSCVFIGALIPTLSFYIPKWLKSRRKKQEFQGSLIKYSEGINSGVISINEARQMQGLEPVKVHTYVLNRCESDATNMVFNCKKCEKTYNVPRYIWMAIWTGSTGFTRFEKDHHKEWGVCKGSPWDRQRFEVSQAFPMIVK